MITFMTIPTMTTHLHIRQHLADTHQNGKAVRKGYWRVLPLYSLVLSQHSIRTKANVKPLRSFHSQLRLQAFSSPLTLTFGITTYQSVVQAQVGSCQKLNLVTHWQKLEFQEHFHPFFPFQCVSRYCQH